MPTMMVGSAAIFIDCDECWKLFLVTRKGSLYLWDLFTRNCLLNDSLASLVTPNQNTSAKDAGPSLWIYADICLLSKAHSHFFSEIV